MSKKKDFDKHFEDTLVNFTMNIEFMKQQER